MEIANVSRMSRVSMHGMICATLASHVFRSSMVAAMSDRPFRTASAALRTHHS
jgi:hypothetical protein